MTQDAILVLQTLFNAIWRLFTSFHIPGTNVTPAAAFLFFIVAGIGLKFLSRMFGIGLDGEGGFVAAVRVSDRIAANKPNPRL